MDERNIRQYAPLIGIQINGAAISGWLMAPCPLAPWKHSSGADRSPSFGIHIDKDGVSGYHCFGCKAKGNLTGLCYQLARYTDDNELIAIGKKIEEIEILGKPFLSSWDTDEDVDFAPEHAKAVYRGKEHERDAFNHYPNVCFSTLGSRYLRRRRISFFTAQRIGIRYDHRENRVLFPVYDYYTRVFEGFTGRTVYNKKQIAKIDSDNAAKGLKKQYPRIRDFEGLNKRNVLLMDRNFSPREHQSITVVEGLFAYARIREFGFANVCALLGSEPLPKKLELLEQFDLPVYWMVDDDTAGQQCLYGDYDSEALEYDNTGALVKMYGKVPQFTVTYPDGITDPDDLSKEQYTDMLANAVLYT